METEVLDGQGHETKTVDLLYGRLNIDWNAYYLRDLNKTVFMT